MTAQAWEIVKWLIGAVGASSVGGIFAVLVANRGARAAKELRADDKQQKLDDASATVRVAVLADRDTWEARLTARVMNLEENGEKERALRHAIEDEQHRDKRRIEELEEQVSKLKKEKVLDHKDFQDKTIEQEQTNIKLQKQLADLQAQYDKLYKEHMEVLEQLKELQKKAEIDQTIGSVELMPKRPPDRK